MKKRNIFVLVSFLIGLMVIIAGISYFLISPIHTTYDWNRIMPTAVTLIVIGVCIIFSPIFCYVRPKSGLSCWDCQP
ncbi:MAG: hypothetical protein ACFE85_17120 [Candidatus Hodarchaeota archaeon]